MVPQFWHYLKKRKIEDLQILTGSHVSENGKSCTGSFKRRYMKLRRGPLGDKKFLRAWNSEGCSRSVIIRSPHPPPECWTLELFSSNVPKMFSTIVLRTKDPSFVPISGRRWDISWHLNTKDCWLKALWSLSWKIEQS